MTVASKANHGGFTLHDLLMGISGAWALPFAVMDVMGKTSAWRLPAFLAAGMGGLFWAWYFRKVGQYVAERVRLLSGVELTADLPFGIGMGIYLGQLSLSFLLQYALYRLIHFALGSVLNRP